jgi:hypothetical protein
MSAPPEQSCLCCHTVPVRWGPDLMCLLSVSGTRQLFPTTFRVGVLLPSREGCILPAGMSLEGVGFYLFRWVYQGVDWSTPFRVLHVLVVYFVWVCCRLGFFLPFGTPEGRDLPGCLVVLVFGRDF